MSILACGGDHWIALTERGGLMVRNGASRPSKGASRPARASGRVATYRADTDSSSAWARTRAWARRRRRITSSRKAARRTETSITRCSRPYWYTAYASTGTTRTWAMDCCACSQCAFTRTEGAGIATGPTLGSVGVAVIVSSSHTARCVVEAHGSANAVTKINVASSHKTR